MGKRRKAGKKKPKKLEGEAAVAWFNKLRRGRPWSDAWPAFLAKPGHQDWWDFHGQAGPLYVIRPDSAHYVPFARRGRIVRFHREKLDRWLRHGECHGRRTIADTRPAHVDPKNTPAQDEGAVS